MIISIYRGDTTLTQNIVDYENLINIQHLHVHQHLESLNEVA